MAGADCKLLPCGRLVGHGDWVTSISAPTEGEGVGKVIISGSRDKKVMVWELDQNLPTTFSETDPGPGRAKRALTGHGQCVQDVVASSDGHFALSASWDKTIRLWDLNSGQTIRRFVKHTSDVNSVAFSADNRQIVSGSRDRTIRLWNTLAECKFTIDVDQHTDWVSAVRFSPTHSPNSTPMIVSCGWDKIVKVWNLPDCKLRTNLVGHQSPLYTVTISPDGSLCASGGKDGVAMLWDATEGKHLHSLDSGPPIQALCFSPLRYWLCSASGSTIKVWDLENKGVLCELQMPKPVDKQLAPEGSATRNKKDMMEKTWITSLSWSADGDALFAGSTDGSIYVYKVVETNEREEPMDQRGG
eukprot:GHVN01019194.1.p1 GENE.GHVN01019194.1~~GHVN01019194.1.p1  ORF type:complete len:358 (+),score=52.35 GHVN01019194.1:980-2053(+)